MRCMSGGRLGWRVIHKDGETANLLLRHADAADVCGKASGA